MSSHTKSDHFFGKYLKNDAPVISYKEKNSSRKTQKDYRGFHTGKDVQPVIPCSFCLGLLARGLQNIIS